MKEKLSIRIGSSIKVKSIEPIVKGVVEAPGFDAKNTKHAAVLSAAHMMQTTRWYKVHDRCPPCLRTWVMVGKHSIRVMDKNIAAIK